VGFSAQFFGSGQPDAGRATLAWLRRLAYLLGQDWHSADDLVQATVTRLFTH
jgi:DNA-directed RNA polymerase specialized sigma24 family protein